MFVPIVVDPEDIISDKLEDVYTSNFNDSDDIISRKRNIIIHNIDDNDRMYIEGECNLKCTIINSCVMNGAFNYDVNSNPNYVLNKTIYNGYVSVPLDKIKDKPTISNSIFIDSKFKINNAYTSLMGIWGSDFNTFAPFGVAVLDMFDLANSISNLRQKISVFGNGNCTIKIDISFDDTNYETILPLPLPQFYNRRHSELNGEYPVILDDGLISNSDLLDKYTKITRLNIDNGAYKYSDEDHSNSYRSNFTYLDHNRNQIFNSSDSSLMPIHIAMSSAISLLDDVFGTIFPIFNRYLMNDLVIVFRSRNFYIDITRLGFSFNNAPNDYVNTIIDIIRKDDSLNTVFDEFANIYDDIDMIIKVTDMRIDVRMILNIPLEDRPDLKIVHYSKSIFDILNSYSPFETSINRPLSMVY